MASPEQIPLNFEEEKNGQHFEENDECQNCGNAFESDSPGCVACRNNTKKIKYLEKLAEGKDQKH